MLQLNMFDYEQIMVAHVEVEILPSRDDFNSIQQRRSIFLYFLCQVNKKYNQE